jgi:hypothetical protein
LRPDPPHQKFMPAQGVGVEFQRHDMLIGRDGGRAAGRTIFK